jgi:hypothetical protein
LVVAAPDDVIRLFDGSEYWVLERPSRPGDPVVMEFRLPDHCAEPLAHVHPHTPNRPGAAARFAMVAGQYPDLLQPADTPMKAAILRTIGRVLRLNVPD